MITLSDAYDPLIADAALAHNVPFEWIKAIIGAESDFNPNAYRAEPRINDASYGLMQILGSTARKLGYTGALEGLYDPMININLGAKLLAQLRRSWGTSFERVYSAYNSGNPDLYKTSNQVAAHVNRAKSYLAEVEKWITYVYPEQEGESGALGLDTLAWLALGAAIVWYFFSRR